MELQYSLTMEDLLKHNLYHNRISAVGRAHGRRVLIAFAGIWFGSAVLVGSLAESGAVFAVALILSGVLTFLGPWIYERLMRRTLRRHLADPRVQGGFGPRRLAVSSTGLKETSAIKESQLPWSSVTEIVRDSEHLYICMLGGTVIVIGRDTYHGPDRFDELPPELERLRAGR